MIEFIIKHLEFIINIFVSLFSGIIGSILGVIVARNYQMVETLRVELNSILLVLSNVRSADECIISYTHGDSTNPQHTYECSIVNELNQSINSLELLIDNQKELESFKNDIIGIRDTLTSNLSSWNGTINNDKTQLMTIHNKKITVQVNPAILAAQSVQYEEALLKLRNNLKRKLQEDKDYNDNFEETYSKFLKNAKDYINRRNKILFPIMRPFKCR